MKKNLKIPFEKKILVHLGVLVGGVEHGEPLLHRHVLHVPLLGFPLTQLRRQSWQSRA